MKIAPEALRCSKQLRGVAVQLTAKDCDGAYQVPCSCFSQGNVPDSSGAAQALCAKARKMAKQSAELKDDLEAFEARLDADAVEVAEEHAAARAAREQVTNPTL